LGHPRIHLVIPAVGGDLISTINPTHPPVINKSKYKITIEYLGTGFCGWQRQEEALSVQQVIEEAIYKFSGETALLTAAGRTDAGVHAYGQVASFDLTTPHEPFKIIDSINFFCRPHKIGIIECELVDFDFDARFSAKKRHYVYKILNRTGVNIINSGQKWWIKDHLDIDSMKKAASYLIGKHDFSAFRASQCQSKSAIKTLEKIEIIKNNDNLEIYVSAISFLHNMVRNIVGNLVHVGRGQWPPEKIKEILESKDRVQGAPTAPAEGLYFLKVEY
jgi:tRNA pseudouridine38-40 synthase